MGLRVALGQIMRVICGDNRIVQLPGQLDEARIQRIFFRHAVAHDLDIEPVAEDLAERLGVLAGRLVVVFQQWRRHHRRHAARQRDEPLVVGRQQIEVDPRLVVVALQKALGDERGEVLVADVARREQRDVGFVADRLLEPPARREVGLAADDRDEPLVLGRVVELDRAEHHAVVGQRDPGRTLVRRLLAQRVDAAGAVEQRVLAVDVQMNEGTQRKANLRRSQARNVNLIPGRPRVALRGTTRRRTGQFPPSSRDALAWAGEGLSEERATKVVRRGNVIRIH